MRVSKVNDLLDVTGDHLGCWIDCSQQSGAQFDIQLVETAFHFGFVIDVEDWKELKNQLDDYPQFEYLYEDLQVVAESAFDWLNTQIPEGYFFYIQDNSLFLTHEDMELIND